MWVRTSWLETESPAPFLIQVHTPSEPVAVLSPCYVLQRENDKLSIIVLLCIYVVATRTMYAFLSKIFPYREKC